MPIIASWDKLTSKAKQAVQSAGHLASKRGNPELMPLHLLASLLADREGTVVPVLSKIGVDSQAVLAEARRLIDQLPALWAGGALKAEPSSAASAVLKQAFKRPPTSTMSTSPPNICSWPSWISRAIPPKPCWRGTAPSAMPS